MQRGALNSLFIKNGNDFLAVDPVRQYSNLDPARQYADLSSLRLYADPKWIKSLPATFASMRKLPLSGQVFAKPEEGDEYFEWPGKDDLLGWNPKSVLEKIEFRADNTGVFSMRLHLEDGKKSPIIGNNYPLSNHWDVPPGSTISGIKFVDF